MFRSSQRTCSTLVNHWLISKRILNRTASSGSNIQTVTSNLVANKPNSKLNEKLWEDDAKIAKVARLINDYSDPESINWKQFKIKLNKLNIKEHHVAILKACLRLHSLKAGISFFNHVVKSGKELSILELVFFIKLFHWQREEISKYEDVVKYVYDNIKVYMKSSAVIQNYIIDLISEIPSCFNDFITNINDDLQCCRGNLVTKALQGKNLEVAYQLLLTADIHFINSTFDSLIHHFCEMAVEKKFSPEMITTFVTFLETKTHIISNENFLSLMDNLVSTLNSNDENYTWKLRKCTISDTSVCSKCNSKLVDKCISKSELNSLKEAFLGQAGLIDKNIFLSTSENELQKFLTFLNNSKPYDVVIDGLNILFSGKGKEGSELLHLLKYFLDKGSRVLVIARVHANRQVTSLPILKQYEYKNNVQFFFTENWSDDDVFTLYAALHGGLGTYFCSNDFLNSYAARLQNDHKCLFVKWKLYHQYLSLNFNIFPPRPYLGLSQLTVSENKKLVWHISYSDKPVHEGKLNSMFPLKWVCLQAHKKVKLNKTKIKNNIRDLEKDI